MRLITSVIVHCSDTPPDMNIGATEIAQWHTAPPPKGNGWSAIGYHYVIRRDGTIENGRDTDGDGNIDEEVGAHAAGHNANSIGICLVGGSNKNRKPDCNFTFQQYAALYSLSQQLLSRYPGIRFIGHRDVSDKACPTFNVQTFFGETQWQ